MTSREFCYWLQGFFEIAGGPQAMTKEQAEMISRHLSMVFVHEIDPSYPQKGVLDHLHNAKTKPGDVVMRC